MKIIGMGFKISAIAGALFSFLMCYIGWQHNPKCEFHCDDFVDWPFFISLWVSWFAVIGVLGGVCIGLVLYLCKLLRSIRKL